MMSESINNDKTLGSWLKQLQELEVFKAQVELEDRILSSCRSKLEALRLDEVGLDRDYVSVRSMIDTIKQLKNMRAYLIENRNPRNPA